MYRYKVGQVVKCACGSDRCAKGRIVGMSGGRYIVDDPSDPGRKRSLDEEDAVLINNLNKERIAYDPQNKPNIV